MGFFLSIWFFTVSNGSWCVGNTVFSLGLPVLRWGLEPSQDYNVFPDHRDQFPREGNDSFGLWTPRYHIPAEFSHFPRLDPQISRNFPTPELTILLLCLLHTALAVTFIGKIWVCCLLLWGWIWWGPFMVFLLGSKRLSVERRQWLCLGRSEPFPTAPLTFETLKIVLFRSFSKTKYTALKQHVIFLNIQLCSLVKRIYWNQGVSG